MNRYIFKLDSKMGVLFTNRFNITPGIMVRIDNDIISNICCIQFVIVLGADCDDVTIDNTKAIKYRPNIRDVMYDIRLTV